MKEKIESYREEFSSVYGPALRKNGAPTKQYQEKLETVAVMFQEKKRSIEKIDSFLNLIALSNTCPFEIGLMNSENCDGLTACQKCWENAFNNMEI